MSHVADDINHQIKVTVIGPSRVGKTSLLTSFLSQAEDYLEGTRSAIFPSDNVTAKRVQRNNDDLNSCLPNGDRLTKQKEFHASTIPGNSETAEFNFTLSTGGAELQIKFLDVPGGWLNADHTRDEKGWAYYQAWIRESAVIIIPIDATIIMEGMKNEMERRFAIRNLQIDAVKRQARMWAKARRANNAPGLVIFAPVKCESYFPRGTVGEKANMLYDRISRAELYGDVVKAIKGEWSDNVQKLDIEYHPVGTLGCVEAVRGEYVGPKEQEYFQVTYRLKEPYVRQPFGADGILFSIGRTALLAVTAHGKQSFTQRFIRWLTGESKVLTLALGNMRGAATAVLKERRARVMEGS